MIELVSSERCVGCTLCVKVCPTNVFDKNEDGVPIIARQEDCQTCFICEAYCPVDALYVAPFEDPLDVVPSEEELIQTKLLGSWRETIGWGKGRTTLAEVDTTPFIDLILPPRR
ncbi:ferredoxin family protein [Paenibacillus sp. HWE-109]|uniref:4Fe-4S dicluster domain-containing protein n=1 Tax=Paenibacillus sp. HWE-109 TaxID=1306526 RepID=UPI001EDF9399|nr:ferredoxin family protein [Paenibacillus sp. HWE-109]UKS29247.1 ferredoxin family protein [Paenibacillus sp. HWE-109]